MFFHIVFFSYYNTSDNRFDFTTLKMGREKKNVQKGLTTKKGREALG